MNRSHFSGAATRFENETRQLEHSEWINVVDAFPNFQFAEALMETLGTEGTFLIWSMHENSVLNDIRQQMDKYKYNSSGLRDWLHTIVKFDGHPSAHIVDMCDIAKRCYFHPKMKGRLSLKFVLARSLGDKRITPSRILAILQT